MAQIGTSVGQPPAALVNTANALLPKYIQPFIADAIFAPSPAYWRMTRAGRKFKGGSALVWSVISQEETTGGPYFGTQLLNTGAVDSIQPAELQWKFYYESIVIPETDLLLGDGPGQTIDLIAAKTEVAMGSLLQKLSRAVWGTAPNNTANDLDPLTTPLAAASTGTYAGIAISAANGFWVCGGINGVLQGASASGVATSMLGLQQLYGGATWGNEEPDTVLVRQQGWNAIWNLMQGVQRFEQAADAETTRAGFRHIMFNNAVVLHDNFVPANNVFNINTKYAFPVFHSRDYFTVSPFIRPTNQRVVVAQVFVTMNLEVVNPRMHSRETSFTDA